MSTSDSYSIPNGPLSLSGPIERAAAHLPMRGDLAHIALAHRYLVAHYVVPQIETLNQATDMRENAKADAEIICALEAEQSIELLDIAGDWAWVCLGPEGPAGYVALECIALEGKGG